MGRVHIFLGAYGSGKTETAVNFALHEREAGRGVVLIDLDIVNPYFRSREIRADLSEQGIQVVSSAAGLEEADLPALSPAIIGALQNESLRVVLDVGGDPAGARALARFHNQLSPLGPEVLAVVNPFRPETRDARSINTMVASLGKAGRQPATGLVANPNLGPETTVSTIVEGTAILRQAAAELRLPLAFTCVRADLAAEVERLGIKPLLPLRRYMLLPWEKHLNP